MNNHSITPYEFRSTTEQAPEKVAVFSAGSAEGRIEPRVSVCRRWTEASKRCLSAHRWRIASCVSSVDAESESVLPSARPGLAREERSGSFLGQLQALEASFAKQSLLLLDKLRCGMKALRSRGSWTPITRWVQGLFAPTRLRGLRLFHLHDGSENRHGVGTFPDGSEEPMRSRGAYLLNDSRTAGTAPAARYPPGGSSADRRLRTR